MGHVFLDMYKKWTVFELGDNVRRMPVFDSAKAREANAKSQIARKARAMALQAPFLSLPAIPREGALQRLSETIRVTLAQEILRCVEALAHLRLGSSLSSIRARASVLEPLTRSAKTVLGWSDSTSSPLVNLQVLGEVKVSVPSNARVNVTTTPAGQGQLVTQEQTDTQEKSMLNATEPPAQAEPGNPL